MPRGARQAATPVATALVALVVAITSPALAGPLGEQSARVGPPTVYELVKRALKRSMRAERKAEKAIAIARNHPIPVLPPPPRGLPGPPGPAGPPRSLITARHDSAPVALGTVAGDTATARAECDSGEAATGGGYELSSQAAGVTVTSSLPETVSDIEGWTIVARRDVDGAAVELTASVVCQDLVP